MIKSCGGVVFRQDGETTEYLLIKSKGGYIDFPKGRQEENETDLETAKREILEETNYNVEFEKTFKSTICFTMPRDGELKRVTFFLCYALNKGTHQIDPDEISEVMWLNYQDAFDAISFDNSKAVLENARDFINTKYLEFVEDF
jgi:tRNA nucleotidyltransferase (CCA-adding enzyme)